MKFTSREINQELRKKPPKLKGRVICRSCGYSHNAKYLKYGQYFEISSGYVPRGSWSWHHFKYTSDKGMFLCFKCGHGMQLALKLTNNNEVMEVKRSPWSL